MDMWWIGPFRLTKQLGADSFWVENSSRELCDVYRSQLKIYECSEEMAAIYPMCFRTKNANLGVEVVRQVKAVLRHRSTPENGLEFLTQLEGEDVSEATWEPMSVFVAINCRSWSEYCERFIL